MPFLSPFNHQSLSAAALGAASESDLIPCADVLAHEPLTNDPDGKTPCHLQIQKASFVRHMLLQSS